MRVSTLAKLARPQYQLSRAAIPALVIGAFAGAWAVTRSTSLALMAAVLITGSCAVLAIGFHQKKTNNDQDRHRIRFEFHHRRGLPLLRYPRRKRISDSGRALIVLAMTPGGRSMDRVLWFARIRWQPQQTLLGGPAGLPVKMEASGPGPN